MEGGGAPTVVLQKKSEVNTVFGFLTVVLGLAFVRLITGDMPDPGRLIIAAVLAVFLIGCAAAWILVARRRAQFEIADDSITLSYRGGARSERLPRLSGELAVIETVGRYRGHYLVTPGSNDRLPLWGFDVDEVLAACRSRGWRFTDASR
jgi:hypothetical protein